MEKKEILFSNFHVIPNRKFWEGGKRGGKIVTVDFIIISFFQVEIYDLMVLESDKKYLLSWS